MEGESVYRNVPLAALFATLGILFPLLFHFTGLGSMFLPMFLPITMAASLLPPSVAILVAILVPLLSFLFTGMPPLYPPILLLVMVELVVISGITSYLFFRKKWSIWLTLLISLSIDRFILYLFVLMFATMFGFPERFYSTGAVLYGMPGIILIFLIVPATINFLGRRYPHILKR
ncbi:MAG: hypothetical protein KAT07_10020 [Calditrichia bacterium]|nr:hypothetical protein [Calditrichia bacterium]